MHSIDITFSAFLLNDYDVDLFRRHNGPVFHRWLPNGEQDALSLNYPDTHTTVRLWFERRGYVDESGFIKHEHKRKEVDDSIIPRQAILEAGAIFGCVTLIDVPESEYNAVINNNTGAAEYISIGKRVVKKIVDPLLARFAKILRDTYGQYWISPPSTFDSRDCSLGQYCHRRTMRWKTPDEMEGEFIPNEKSTETVSIILNQTDYSEYMTRDIWFSLTELLNSDYEPSIATTISSRARRLLYQGRLEHALIEVVTSLEIAIEEHVRRKIQGNKKLFDATQSFWQLNLPTRIGLISSLADVCSEDIEEALLAVTARNDFVHEGKPPPSSTKTHIQGVLNIIRALSGPILIKFPSAHHGNKLRCNAEDWDKSLSITMP
jgi:hypothetical protein